MLRIVQFSSNWNNSLNAGVSYQNANNNPSFSARDISTHLELRINALPEQQHNQLCIYRQIHNEGVAVY